MNGHRIIYNVKIKSLFSHHEFFYIMSLTKVDT